MFLHHELQKEFDAMDVDIQDELLSSAKALELAGPKTGRPLVDTLCGSIHRNMEELRFNAKNGTQIWRAAFAFDPKRNGLKLVAACKQGKSQSEFYRKLIKTADQRFTKHLAIMNKPAAKQQSSD